MRESCFHIHSRGVLTTLNDIHEMSWILLEQRSPSSPNLQQREKIKSNVYFHTSLWCLKRFYESLKGLHKTFCDTTKKCENKNLIKFFIPIKLSEMHGTERIKNIYCWLRNYHCSYYYCAINLRETKFFFGKIHIIVMKGQCYEIYNH